MRYHEEMDRSKYELEHDPCSTHRILRRAHAGRATLFAATSNSHSMPAFGVYIKLGIHLFELPDRKVPIINARSETAADKPLVDSSVQHRRCLLPANGYYEWDAKRNKYTIDHGKPFYMVGILRPEDGQTT